LVKIEITLAITPVWFSEKTEIVNSFFILR